MWGPVHKKIVGPTHVIKMNGQMMVFCSFFCQLFKIKCGVRCSAEYVQTFINPDPDADAILWHIVHFF